MRKKAQPQPAPSNLAIEHLPIDSITDFPNNSRMHTVEQIELIAKSIKEFGFTNPVLVDANNELIAGHARKAAAGLVGMDTVPAIRLGHLSPNQKRALVIADNKIAITGTQWDYTLLKLELSELQLADFDLRLTGFDSNELDKLFPERRAGLTDEDDAPEPPADPVTVLGDVWLLGSHRLVCGDSTSPESVSAALNGVKPHLMVTDPPYGVNDDASWRQRAGISSPGAAIGVVTNDDRADWSEAWALFPGDVAYVWQGDKQITDMSRQLGDNGFVCRHLIIWSKSQFAIGRGDYHLMHETCWYAVRKGGTGHWVGDRKQTSVWQIDKPVKSETGHSTQKPVECMKRPIENNSSPGQAVYEPFAGSFTTGIACQMTGRVCHAIELSPTYIDVGVIRWQNFTGQQATLEATGATFAEVTQDRAKALA